MMITKREMRRVAKPVVLIAEELSPATLEALVPVVVRVIAFCFPLNALQSVELK